jgi:hypothetical protein
VSLPDAELEAQLPEGLDAWAGASGLAPRGNSDPADLSSLEGYRLAITLARWLVEELLSPARIISGRVIVSQQHGGSEVEEYIRARD